MICGESERKEEVMSMHGSGVEDGTIGHLYGPCNRNLAAVHIFLALWASHHTDGCGYRVILHSSAAQSPLISPLSYSDRLASRLHDL